MPNDFKRRPHDGSQFLGARCAAEQLDGVIHLLFEVTEADDLAKTLLLVQHAVGAAERLQQAVILHVLVHIKRVEFLAVKARKEHAHHKKQVERFHRRILLLHTAVDIIVVGTEILD